ncbi:phosphoprotein [Clonorchis sinensis]|uniref:Phosphoprotein n=1 Tax=Clonorchis sinensis TaxID=79923 RepID=G7YS80_CLOSI|nr:phosphoprotein [Clonorchis sinensis]
MCQSLTSRAIEWVILARSALHYVRFRKLTINACAYSFRSKDYFVSTKCVHSLERTTVVRANEKVGDLFEEFDDCFSNFLITYDDIRYQCTFERSPRTAGLRTVDPSVSSKQNIPQNLPNRNSIISTIHSVGCQTIDQLHWTSFKAGSPLQPRSTDQSSPPNRIWMRGKRSHKGKSRCFTSPEEMDRQLGRSKSPNGDEEPVASTSELPITVPDESDSDGDGMRHKGISHFIEVCNPNLDDKSAKEGPSRKEAEAAARAVADSLSLKSEAELAMSINRSIDGGHHLTKSIKYENDAAQENFVNHFDKLKISASLPSQPNAGQPNDRQDPTDLQTSLRFGRIDLAERFWGDAAVNWNDCAEQHNQYPDLLIWYGGVFPSETKRCPAVNSLNR